MIRSSFRFPVLVGRTVLVLLAAVLLQACGPPAREVASDVRYEPPMERTIVVETVVSMPFDEAWSELIRRLSESAFQVSTLEKASRFVRVDLTRSSDLAKPANQPSRYVDCGTTVRSHREGEAEPQVFEYRVADSSRHRQADPIPEGFRVSDVERRVDLDASATIFLQPEGKSRTRVAVKSRYRIEFEIAGRAAIHPSDPDEPIGAMRPFGPRAESIRFTTFQPGRDQRQGGLTCRATGDFEHALVALANPAAAI